ncbi:MAG: S41 family peptidase [Coriobacteriia bacterium]|nr:S41 family peptidase [Coriobacteriia bacterium]
MNRWIKVVLCTLLAAAMFAGGFAGGYLFAVHDRFGEMFWSGGARDRSVGDAVNEVVDLLAGRALDPVNETSATAGAIQGLLESTGDKYAVYFDPRHFEYFNEESHGEFGGVGVVLGEKDGATYVVEVYPDTPAANAGVRSGDIFVDIDGTRRDKWPSEEVVKRVRGKEGTKVSIVFKRLGTDGASDKEVSVTLTRAMIELPNIKSELEGSVGYIRLSQFNEKAVDKVAEAITDLEKKGAKSFVLDLRDNPGGLLNQAEGVSSLFLESGVVVQVEERDKKPEKRSVSSRYKQITKAPVVLLINGNSASASEIVAGALQDHKRATLVGENSFGKGSVQTVEPLHGGGGVKFTIAHYLTPNGRVIDGKGLTPDIVVEMDPEKQADPKTDTQLQRALAEARKAQQ